MVTVFPFDFTDWVTPSITAGFSIPSPMSGVDKASDDWFAMERGSAPFLAYAVSFKIPLAEVTNGWVGGNFTPAGVMVADVQPSVTTNGAVNTGTAKGLVVGVDHVVNLELGLWLNWGKLLDMGGVQLAPFNASSVYLLLDHGVHSVNNGFPTSFSPFMQTGVTIPLAF
jgi:hypothetical protein